MIYTTLPIYSSIISQVVNEFSSLGSCIFPNGIRDQCLSLSYFPASSIVKAAHMNNKVSWGKIDSSVGLAWSSFFMFYSHY